MSTEADFEAEARPISVRTIIIVTVIATLVAPALIALVLVGMSHSPTTAELRRQHQADASRIAANQQKIDQLEADRVAEAARQAQLEAVDQVLSGQVKALGGRPAAVYVVPGSSTTTTVPRSSSPPTTQPPSSPPTTTRPCTVPLLGCAV